MKNEWKFGQKNQWRRRMWNRIASTMSIKNKPTKQAIVLFLAGKGLNDVTVATEKRFRKENLIAVTLETTVRDECRAAGVPCIVGELASVVTCWPSHTPLDAIYADYYSCYSVTHVSLIMALLMTNGIARDYVPLVVSAQRGRESGRSRDMVDICRRRFSGVPGANLPESNHRGLVFASRFILEVQALYEMGAILRESDCPPSLTDLQLSRSWCPGIIYDSYRSEPVTMDSVFMQLSIPFAPIRPSESGKICSSSGKLIDLFSMKKNIPAVLAVRSKLMRRKSHSKYCDH